MAGGEQGKDWGLVVMCDGGALWRWPLQLRALGTPQHLKNKFGSGYEIITKLDPAGGPIDAPERVQKVTDSAAKGVVGCGEVACARVA